MHSFSLGVIAGILITTAFFYGSNIKISVDNEYNAANQSNITQESGWLRPLKKLQNFIKSDVINELRKEEDFVNIEPEACVQTNVFHGGMRLITGLLNRGKSHLILVLTIIQLRISPLMIYDPLLTLWLLRGI